MTVGELIKRLSAFPDEREVCATEGGHFYPVILVYNEDLSEAERQGYDLDAEVVVID